MADSTWQVTGQLADQTQITSAGQVVTGHLVYFITGDGHRDSVFVPDDHYTPDSVRALIAAQAARADAVGQLSSQG